MCSDARAEGNIVPEVVILENKEMLAALTTVTASKPLAQKFLSNLIQQVRLAHVAVLCDFALECIYGADHEHGRKSG